MKTKPRYEGHGKAWLDIAFDVMEFTGWEVTHHAEDGHPTHAVHVYRFTPERYLRVLLRESEKQWHAQLWYVRAGRNDLQMSLTAYNPAIMAVTLDMICVALEHEARTDDGLFTLELGVLCDDANTWPD